MDRGPGVNGIFSIIKLDCTGDNCNEFNSVIDMEKIKIVEYKSYSWVLTNDKIEKIKNKIILFLEKFHLDSPASDGCNKNEIAQKIEVNEDLVSYILNELLKANELKNSLEFWSLSNFNVSLDSNLEKIANEIDEYIQINNYIDKKTDIIKKINISNNEFHAVLSYLEKKDKVVKIDINLFYCMKNVDKIKADVESHFKKNNTLTISQFKEISNTTRKLAVPLLEYLDKINITCRIGNERKLYG